MDPVTLLLIALSLSMDAFCVAVSIGIVLKTPRPAHALRTGAFFGGFQAGMPLLGWLAGRTVADLIRSVDHWVAFGLLSLIGGRMFLQAFLAWRRGEDCALPDGKSDPTSTRRLLTLAVATSIDALAVGVGLAFLRDGILPAVLLIGVITFSLSALGVFLGRRLGCLFQQRAEMLGGLILVGIGIRILAEHLAATPG